MDSRALKYFLAVAELKNYSRAAERLHIGQPALSRKILNLEEELGHTLFNRLGHGVSLTPAGSFLLERSRSILRQIEQTSSAIRHGDISPQEVITIAVAPVIGRYLVPYLMQEIDHKEIRTMLRVVSGSSSNFEDWLSRGTIDVACMYDFIPRRGYAVEACAHESLHVFGRSDIFTDDAPGINARDIARLPLIMPSEGNHLRRNFERWMADQQAPVQVKAEVDDHSTLRGCLLAGEGYAVMAAGALDADVKAGTIRSIALSPACQRLVCMVAAAHGARADVAQKFASFAAAKARDLANSGVWPARPVYPKTE